MIKKITQITSVLFILTFCLFAAIPEETWGTANFTLSKGQSWTGYPTWLFNIGTAANPIAIGGGKDKADPAFAAPYNWELTQNQTGSLTTSGSNQDIVKYTAGDKDGLDIMVIRGTGMVTVDPIDGLLGFPGVFVDVEVEHRYIVGNPDNFDSDTPNGDTGTTTNPTDNGKSLGVPSFSGRGPAPSDPNAGGGCFLQ